MHRDSIGRGELCGPSPFVPAGNVGRYSAFDLVHEEKWCTEYTSIRFRQPNFFVIPPVDTGEMAIEKAATNSTLAGAADPLSESQSATHSGGRYDNALRGLIDGQPRAVAEFVTGRSFAEPIIRFGSTELPGTTLRLDTIIETEFQRIHIEFQHRSRAPEIEPRLVHYWARLFDPKKPIVEQHVVVLDPRGGRLSGEFRHGRLILGYTAHHLWDISSESLLMHPTLYPLAVLGSALNREAVLGQIIEKAQDHQGAAAVSSVEVSNSDSAMQTVAVAITLASVYLPMATLEDILERTNMTVLFSELPLGRELLRRKLLEGRELGLQEGREEGREEGLRQTFRVLAEQRFGILPDPVIELLGSVNIELADFAHVLFESSDLQAFEASLRA